MFTLFASRPAGSKPVPKYLHDSVHTIWGIKGISVSIPPTQLNTSRECVLEYDGLPANFWHFHGSYFLINARNIKPQEVNQSLFITCFLSRCHTILNHASELFHREMLIGINARGVPRQVCDFDASNVRFLPMFQLVSSPSVGNYIILRLSVSTVYVSRFPLVWSHALNMQKSPRLSSQR